ncbi:MAG: hypothetical protein V8R01_06550 [Bacilli bacterium]|jgi:hypothetical protein|nr:MAG TPA: hypothetical protein [Caudoviricetes sp.]
MKGTNFFINNRELIKNLALNTATSDSPTFTTMCTTSEVTINTEFEEKTFYVFCDAVQRAVLTGVAMGLEATVKIDMNNTAIQNVLGDLSTMISTGTIAQFNNQLIQFELLTGISTGTLEYTKFQVPANLKLSDLGGAAEDEGEFSLEITFNGKGSVVSE